jgi:hypothetical protein
MAALQWRRGLKLAGEEAVENCTLEGVRALRTMLSATVHDVLYYMSPLYCQEINDSVRYGAELIASIRFFFSTRFQSIYVFYLLIFHFFKTSYMGFYVYDLCNRYADN